MKRITDLDVKIPHPDPADDAELAKKQQDDMPTPRRLLKFLTIGIPPATVDESDQMHQVRMKLMIADQDFVDVEEAEFSMLRKHVDANKLAWGGAIHHHMIDLMRQAEKRKIEVKVQEKKDQ